MRRLAAFLVLTALVAGPAAAQTRESKPDPLGDLIVSALVGAMPGTADFKLKASLYHAGAKGIGALDSLGCKVVAMRTAAVDGLNVKRRTVLFIKETVGLPMPDGTSHDGFWYASDKGGDIKGNRIDLFTGDGKASMKPMMPLNLSTLTVSKVGEFKGCPPN